MSKASNIISSSVTGEDYKTIYLGGKTYRAYPPTIYNICRAINRFEKFDLENQSYRSIIANFSEVKKSILTGLSFLMRGVEQYDPNMNGIVMKDQGYPKEMEKMTLDEVNEALKTCFSLIDNSSFDVCKFEVERPDEESTVKFIGNKTFLGQIATFIENLHLSYKEVVEEIPYRVLLVMQKDKLHRSYGEQVKYTSAKENKKYKNLIK